MGEGRGPVSFHCLLSSMETEIEQRRGGMKKQKKNTACFVPGYSATQGKEAEEREDVSYVRPIAHTPR